MTLLTRLTATLLAFILLTVSALAAGQTMIILDASGSMWAKFNGQPRIVIARQTLDDVLTGVPDDLQLGFMAYGHRSKTDCNDIELLVPPAAGTAGAIEAAAGKVQPKGMTPLSAAVKQAAGMLAYTSEKATVILITDGIETCHDDPCALATQLKASGVDFTVDVVGLALSDSEGAQVSCLAKNTGGKYFQANDAKGLSQALTQSVAEVAKPAPPPPPPAPAPAADTGPSFQAELTLSEGGPLIKDNNPQWDVYVANADGSKGEEVDSGYGAPRKADLKPGDYIVDAKWDAATAEQKVTVVAGQVAKPVIVLNAGHLKVHALPAPGAKVEDSTQFDITFDNGSDLGGYGDIDKVVPAGTSKVKATLNTASASVDVPVAAGQTVEQDLILNAGHITANASYGEGGDKVTDGGIVFDVVGSKKKIDGSREDFGTSYGPDNKRWLAVGDYVMEVTMDAAKVEVPFTVTAGGETAVDVDLEAGVAAITAPGAQRIVVYGAKKKIDGSRDEMSSTYAATFQTTLPAGDYVASAIMDSNDTVKEAPFTVKANERTELTVPTGQ